MNTVNNKRRKASCQKIEKAFMGLLQTEQLDQISVSRLCQITGLNRTTFYANYLDIYDLADKLREQMEANFHDLYKEEITIGFNSNNYLKLFRNIYENQLFYKTYLKLGYNRQFGLLQYDTQLAEKHFHGRFIEYHCEFFRAGITRIIEMWLAGGCQQTPEEMNEIVGSEYQGRTGK